MKRLTLGSVVTAVCAALVLPATASAGHGLKYTATLDHPAPAVAPPFPGLPVVNAGGPGAQWEYIASFFTGDPHTDLDFFTQRGETYMSAGTLGTGANGAGQTIFQLTQR